MNLGRKLAQLIIKSNINKIAGVTNGLIIMRFQNIYSMGKGKNSDCFFFSLIFLNLLIWIRDPDLADNWDCSYRRDWTIWTCDFNSGNWTSFRGYAWCDNSPYKKCCLSWAGNEYTPPVSRPSHCKGMHDE